MCAFECVGVCADVRVYLYARARVCVRVCVRVCEMGRVHVHVHGVPSLQWRRPVREPWGRDLQHIRIRSSIKVVIVVLSEWQQH